jgi:GT2 family glycosyltransferase
MDAKAVDIIIISYNCHDLTLKCIDSIQSTVKDIKYGITVVDNASTDDTVDILEKDYPSVNIIQNERNMGYGAAANIGARQSGTPFIIISNADVIYHDGSIEKLIGYLKENPDTAVVSPQQQYLNGQWQYSYGDYPGIKDGLKHLFFIHYIENHIRRSLWKIYKVDQMPSEPDYLDGAVLAFRKKDYTGAGGFDEDYFFYSEEADICLRLKQAGKRVVFLPAARITHVRGGISAPGGMKENNIRMLVKGKLLFCRKHLNSGEISKYIRMIVLHLSFFSFVLGILQHLLPGRLKSRLKAKAGAMNMHLKVWEEQSRIIKEEMYGRKKI